ncbi:hypothetical protein PGB90_005655 [Kerria lacca]
MTIKEFFDFITDATISQENMERYLDKISEKLLNMKPLTDEQIIDEEVFKKAFIPKTLNEVIDFERDINLVKSGVNESLIYQKIVGLKDDLSGPQNIPSILNSEPDDSEISSSESEKLDNECVAENEQSKFINSARPKHETTEEKKKRKKEVKEQKAEKRKVKIKKHVKKRKEKMQKTNSK